VKRSGTLSVDDAFELQTLSNLINDPRGYTLPQIEELQLALAARVKVEPLITPISTICAVDCAYSQDNSRIFAAALLFDTQGESSVAVSHAVLDCLFPYIPGLLALREAPAMLQAIRRLSTPPDLILIDGHGTAHPRSFGLACVVGLLLEIPTLGVGKGRLCGDYEMPGPQRGACTPLFMRRVAAGSAKRIGTVLRTQTSVKPLYVSPGHRISHEESIQWALRLANNSRVPEPLRLAHQQAAELRTSITNA